MALVARVRGGGGGARGVISCDAGVGHAGRLRWVCLRKEGVLHIRLPKTAESRARRIELK